MPTPWMNDDGLYIKFGTDKADAVNGGEYNVLGGEHWVEFDLDLTTLGSSAAIINDVVFLPKNVRVERVEVIVLTATAGTSSNLNLGLMKFDRTTAIDADGLLAAADAFHTSAAGVTTVYYTDTTEAGVLIGDDSGNDPGYFCAFYDTGAYTDGLLKIRVFWTKV